MPTYLATWLLLFYATEKLLPYDIPERLCAGQLFSLFGLPRMFEIKYEGQRKKCCRVNMQEEIRNQAFDSSDHPIFPLSLSLSPDTSLLPLE